MPVTVQATAKQDQAEKLKRAASKSRLDFSGGFVCLFVGGWWFLCLLFEKISSGGMK